MLTVKHEEISPLQAHAYLAKSVGNRTLNHDYVLSLAVAMESGKWDESASEIVFDEAGALIDGHHRLNAVVTHGGIVRMLVKRGVSKAARGLIDTGRTRNIRDLMMMFRSGETYVNQRKASLTVAVGLLMGGGRPPAIRTLDAYDAWMRQFSEGIEAIVALGALNGRSPLRLGPVSGAFAFAHKMNPKKVEAFIVKVGDGVGLEMKEPAHTLRSLIFKPGSAKGHRGADRYELSRKVLSALHADIRGLPYRTAQAGRDGLEYFRTAYDTKTIKQMVELWTHDVAKEKAA